LGTRWKAAFGIMRDRDFPLSTVAVTSLRWHDPDQVMRVAEVALRLSAGHP